MVLESQDPESSPMTQGLFEFKIIGSFLILQGRNKQKNHLTWIGMTLAVKHSELAILFQNVEVTVSLHRLRKKPMLISRSTSS